MSVVPVIDISKALRGDATDRLAVARKIGEACENVGFLMVTGHGIPRSLVDEVDSLCRSFFHLPEEEKQKVASEPGKPPRGHRALGSSTLARTEGDLPPDIRESFVTGPEAEAGDPYYQQAGAARFFAPNVWPDRPAELQATFESYYGACSKLAGELMKLFALALDLPESFFDDKIDREISALNVNHYPRQKVAAKPGQIRAGAHTDYGSLTILATDGSPGGLQLWLDNEWQDVMPPQDAFIINLGDLMAQWTNDRWRSTLHRVINPPSEVAATTERQSIVFFHQPNFDAPIVCLPTCVAPGAEPKYAPTTSGEHLMAELAKTYAARRKFTA